MRTSPSISRLMKASLVMAIFAFAAKVPAGDCLPAIEVTSNGDVGAGTLRDALENICPNGTITFNASMMGQSIAIFSPLVANVPVTIHGLGASHLRIDADQETRILNVGAQGGVHIDGITFSNGIAPTNLQDPSNGAGGAIAYQGLFFRGKSETPRLPFTASTLDNCFFQNNSAGNGGAIYNAALLSIQTCTFAGNTADSDGGALFADSGAAVTITSFLNSTLFQNSAGNNGGAIAITGGDIDMTYCTLTKNTSDSNAGGSGDAALYISTDGTAFLSGNLIAQNVDATPTSPGKKSTGDRSPRGGSGDVNPDVRDFDSATTITSVGYNLIGDATGSDSFVSEGDQAGTAQNPINAKLADLTDNGGPTETCALMSDSPAIDAGNPESFPDEDQRGITRPQLNAPDIGAFELQSNAQIVVRYFGPIVANGDTLDLGPSQTSVPLTGTLTIENDGTTTLTVTSITVTGDFSLVGTFPSTNIAPTGQATFNVQAASATPGDVTGTVTINNNDVDDNPYIIYLLGNFCNAQITVIDPADSGPGTLRQALLDICPGGLIDFDEGLANTEIALTSGELLIEKDNVTIQGLGANKLSVSGGNLSRVFHSVVENSTINDLRIADGFTTETLDRQSTFDPFGGAGGAILNAPSKNGKSTRGLTFPDIGMFLNRCAIEDSTAAFFGGGIANLDVLTMDSCTVEGNHSDGDGGGIGNDESAFIVNSTIAKNTAVNFGGGIENDLFSFLALQYCTISENTADADADNVGDGGGIDGGGIDAGGNSAKSAKEFTILTVVTNTIVAGNVDASPDVPPSPEKQEPLPPFPDVHFFGQGGVISNGGNIIGDPSTDVNFVNGVNGDQVGTHLAPLDPGLNPLGSYGGPTRVYLPLTDSIAIDAADDDTTLALDQRGRSRPKRQGFDTGSVERGVPPVAICQNVTVEASTNCSAFVPNASVSNGSHDPDGGPVFLSVTSDNGRSNGERTPADGHTYPLGQNPVILTVTDDEGDTDTCTATVTVVDTTDPDITCPANIAVTAPDGGCNADVTVPAPIVTDACNVTVTNDFNGGADASGVYPPGTTTVTFTATDSSNNSSTCSMTVTVNCSLSCAFNGVNQDNAPGTTQTVAVTVHAGSTLMIGTDVTFNVISGPNAGLNVTVATAANGEASIDLSSNIEGTDFIQASGQVDGKTFSCEVDLNWALPIFIDIPFAHSDQGWEYFSPDPFDHPEGFWDQVLAIRSIENTNSFGFWLSPPVITGIDLTPSDRGGVGPQIPVIAGSDFYRVEYTISSTLSDLSMVPTVRARSNTATLQQSDDVVITATDNGDISPPESFRTYPFFIHMPQGDDSFLLSFDMLNFDPRDAATADVYLGDVSVQAVGTDALTGVQSHLFEDFTELNTNGWTYRNAEGFLGVPFAESDVLGLQIGDDNNPIRGERGNAFTVEFGYWGSPEGAHLIDMDHTRLFAATFLFTSGADTDSKTHVPTFRGRVNSGNMQFCAYTLSESMTAQSVTPIADNPISYTMYFQTPPEVDGQEMLFSFDWLYVPNSGNDNTIPVFLKSLTVQSYDLIPEYE